jgi:hypothetical protein
MRGMHISAVTSTRCLGRSNVLPSGNGSTNILSARNDSAISQSNTTVPEKSENIHLTTQNFWVSGLVYHLGIQNWMFPTRCGEGNAYSVGSLNLRCFLVLRILDNGQNPETQ